MQVVEPEITVHGHTAGRIEGRQCWCTAVLHQSHVAPTACRSTYARDRLLLVSQTIICKIGVAGRFPKCQGAVVEEPRK